MFFKLINTLKSLINEQGGLAIRLTLKRACSFIRDFRVRTNTPLKKGFKRLFGFYAAL